MFLAVKGLILFELISGSQGANCGKLVENSDSRKTIGKDVARCRKASGEEMDTGSNVNAQTTIGQRFK